MKFVDHAHNHFFQLSRVNKGAEHFPPHFCSHVHCHIIVLAIVIEPPFEHAVSVPGKLESLLKQGFKEFFSFPITILLSLKLMSQDEFCH